MNGVSVVVAAYAAQDLPKLKPGRMPAGTERRECEVPVLAEEPLGNVKLPREGEAGFFKDVAPGRLTMLR